MRMKRNHIIALGALIGCFLFRLFPLRIPNVEPILAAQMPLSKSGGAGFAFLFGAGSILLFDVFTGTVGMWTLITSLSYGTLGLLASFYFKTHSGVRHYTLFGVFGAVFYDALTGLTVGPLFFNQPFTAALAGQIPFTLYHIMGNVVFALTLSPLLEYLLVKERRRDIPIPATATATVSPLHVSKLFP